MFLCALFNKNVYRDLLIVTLFSISLELIQLFLRMGEFCLSDILLNVGSSLIGRYILSQNYRIKPLTIRYCLQL